MPIDIISAALCFVVGIIFGVWAETVFLWQMKYQKLIWPALITSLMVLSMYVAALILQVHGYILF